MSISGVTRSIVAAGSVAAALVGTAPAQAGPDRSTGALTGAPTVGTCTTMTPAQGAANTDRSTPVPCRRAHTARVAGVARLPARLDWSASRSAIFRVVANRCAPQVNEVLGRTDVSRDTTSYGYFYFEPTKAQKAAGARWVSCSIFLQHGAKLVDLPNNHTPMIPRGKHPDSIARCLTKSVLNTVCSAGHAWRATGTFTVDAARRPAAKALNKTATRKCLPHVDPNKFYRFTYQDKASWAAGDHTVVCYTRTSK